MNFVSSRYGFLMLALLSVFLAGSIILANHSVLSTPTRCIQPGAQPAAMQAIILQAKEAWVRGDAAAFANLFTADGVLIVPGQRWQGRTAIQAESASFLENFTVSIQIRTILIEGKQAAVEWDWHETPKAMGQKSHQAQDAILIDFDGNLIRRWREYIDAETK